MTVPLALHALYEDRHPLIAIRKPTQVGMTEYCLNAALWAADTRVGGRGNVLYLLPTAELAERTSQLRLNHAIQESPYLRSRAQRERGVAPRPANAQRRHIGEGVIVFAGADQQSQYTGFDADVVILDEFDLMRDAVFAVAQQRLRSSAAPQLIVVSTPTTPEAGVSSLFNNSDQRHFELRCQGCDLWQAPRYPDSVDQEASKVICLNCRAVLDADRVGRWVPSRSDQTDMHGYQLSRLTLPRPPLHEMRLAFEGKVPVPREVFQQLDLGLPFASAESCLTVDALDRCAGDYPPLLVLHTRELRTVVMGVDVGRVLHVVIRGLYRGQWVLLEAFTCNSFEELDACFDCYRVSVCVVDSLPEAREARRFAERHAGRVWLSRYNNRSEGHAWSYWPDWIVTSARTAMLDETFARFRERSYRLPNEYASLAGGEYVRQLMVPVRIEIDDRFGGTTVSYKSQRDDDFAHAEVYATLAVLRLESHGVLSQARDFLDF